MYRGGSAFSYQPSIFDSITSTGPVDENAANQCSAAWRDSCSFFLFLYQSRGKFDGACGSGFKKEKRKKQIKRGYTYCSVVGRNREIETRSRQRYTLFSLLFLSFSRESQFSLQPTGHGSITKGETSRRWTRVGRRNIEKEGGTREKEGRRWRKRACKGRRWSMATCVSKYHNF